MQEDKAIEVAARLTSAMIAAGFVPAAVSGKDIKSAAAHAADLYNEVLRQVSESPRPR